MGYEGVTLHISKTSQLHSSQHALHPIFRTLMDILPRNLVL